MIKLKLGVWNVNIDNNNNNNNNNPRNVECVKLLIKDAIINNDDYNNADNNTFRTRGNVKPTLIFTQHLIIYLSKAHLYNTNSITK